MMQNRSNFLGWVYSRLLYKHKEDQSIITRLVKFEEDYFHIPKSISRSIIDKACSEYYLDFYLDKTDELSFGFTEEHRADLRQFITHLLVSLSKTPQTETPQ